MTRFLLITPLHPGRRRISEISHDDLRAEFTTTQRAELGRGKHIRTADGRITVDLLAYYDAMQAFGAAPTGVQP